MNKGRGFQHGWWLVLITLGVMCTASVPLLFFTPVQDSFVSMLFGEIVLLVPLIVGLFMLSLENLPEGVAGSLGLHRFPKKLLPYLILAAACAQPFAGCLLLPVNGVLNVLFGELDYGDITSIANAADFARNFIVMCVAAPVMEELLCRGVLMQLFRRYGVAVMIVYSSLAFAILHLTAQSFISIFFLGVMLGIIRITSGSIYASIIAHSVVNLYALLISNTGSGVAVVLAFIAGIILFPIMIYRFICGCDSGVNWRAGLIVKSSPVGFSLGLLLTAVMFIAVNFFAFIERFWGSVMLGGMYY